MQKGCVVDVVCVCWRAECLVWFVSEWMKVKVSLMKKKTEEW